MLQFFKKFFILVILWAANDIGILGIGCPPLNPPSSGILTYFSGFNDANCEYPVRTLVKIKCKEFYELKGNDTSECLANGMWSNMDFKCYPECGKSSKVVSLIVHGSIARPGFVPWHVAMYHKAENKFEYWCGGTLISDRVVITAAHCTWKVNPQNLRLAFGKFYREFEIKDINSQILRASKIEILKSYQDALGNYNGDISLIFLKKKVKFNDFVRPACIDWDQSYMDEQLKEGNIGVVAGWGLTENDTFSDYLRAVNLPVASDDSCISRQNTNFRKFITYTTFCAGFNNDTGVCNGDSGGGLVFFEKNSERWFIQGLVSVSPRRRGTSFCDPNFFAVFTKVNMFIRWLKSLNIFEQKNSKVIFKKCELEKIENNLKNTEKNDVYKYLKTYLEQYLEKNFLNNIYFPNNKKIFETASPKY